MMILILFAQLSEARATLKRLDATPIEGVTTTVWSEGMIPCSYQFSKGRIEICNMGIHAAQMAVARFAPPFDEVWNIGFAGGLHSHQTLFELVPIRSVKKYIPLKKGVLDPLSQECVTTILPRFHLQEAGKHLISSDFPIHDSSQKADLAEQGDLVDMEGYGIAYASAHLGKKCRMWKILSDFCSEGGRESIRKHKATLSEYIADKIVGELT